MYWGSLEFCSVKLANWLREHGSVCGGILRPQNFQGAYFCLRLKKSEFVEVETSTWIELNNLGLAPGVSVFLKGVKVTKTKGFDSFNVACKWQRKILGVAPKEGWFILTNFETLAMAIAAYKQRFNIEEMFRDFKKGGYNLEGTNASGERLLVLILLIAIAYTSATLQGQQIKRKGIQKYIARVKEYGRCERRHSSFYIGLYGQTWVNFMQDCMEVATELMKRASQ